MTLTDYHAKYFAHELTKRCASDSVEMLAGAVTGAQVDLNPHQVDAALFTFKSPPSTGALLADEVGLVKTIEAGLVISQSQHLPRSSHPLRQGRPQHLCQGTNCEPSVTGNNRDSVIGFP